MTVVLIIISMVATSIMPHMVQRYVINAGRKAALDMSAIEEAGRAYYVTNRTWPINIAVLQSGGYLPASWNGINPFWSGAGDPLGYYYNIASNASTLTVTTTVPSDAESTIKNLLPLVSTSGQSISSTVSIPGSSSSLPSGSIILWSGSVASIPNGWALCNGQNGTPDLTDRFVMAAGGNYSPGQTGDGSLPATKVNVQSDLGAVWANSNGTTFYSPYKPAYVHRLINMFTESDTLSVSFGSGSKNIAVFYALAYIMKI